MPDSGDAPSDHSKSLQWYRDHWSELEEILSVDDPGGVVARVRELQLDALQDQAAAVAESDLTDQAEARRVLQRVHDELEQLRTDNRALTAICDRLDAESAPAAIDAVDALLDEVQTLRERQQAFAEAGFQDPDQALAIIESMEEQLSQLYDEKESTLQTEERAAEIAQQGDTFEQLQALLAREEKLQRELGVSSSDEIISMVNGLVDQLEDLYAERDTRQSPNGEAPSPLADADADPFDRLQKLLEREEKLQRELGVSDPEEVVTMVQGLTSQLDDLYESRERLARINLDDADSVVDMVNSMQSQLEVLYENQERMSEQGIYGVDHALSMIESMEQQLSQLYGEREMRGDVEVETDARLAELQDRLDALREEKERLLERREALEAEKSTYERKMSTLEQNVGTADPEAIAEIINSMEEQLTDLYRNREIPAAQEADDTPAVASPDVFARLDDVAAADLPTADLSGYELDAVDAGIVCVDDRGTVRYANDAALRWPSIDSTDASELVGANFFFDLAPATNNALFRGRFSQAVEQGEMDVRFPYTYVSKNVPLTNFAVHLYRRGPDAPCWILFRPLESGG
jgi:photoactive yellow protein